MSIDDLYGEKSYLRGKISACERKIEELENTNKRLNNEKKEMEEDIKRINAINGKIGKTVRFLNLSLSRIGNARTSVSSYYNGFHTKNWQERMGNSYSSTSILKRNFGKIQKEAYEIIEKLKTEIEKRSKSIEQNKKYIEEKRRDLQNLRNELDDVNYDIEHYYYDDDYC